MTPRNGPEPPAHLSRRAKSWWRSVVVDFELADHHVHLLRLAAESLDRAEQARAALAQYGTTYEDRFGQPRARPEVAIERDSRIAFARLVRELGFDVDEKPDMRFSGNRFRALRAPR